MLKFLFVLACLIGTLITLSKGIVLLYQLATWGTAEYTLATLLCIMLLGAAKSLSWVK